MATKSTKIRNSRICKLTLVLIASVFVFFGVYLFEGLFDFYRHNGVPLFYMDKTESVLGGGNTAFAEEIRKDADRILELCTVYKSDEAVESGEAFAPREAEIKKNTERMIQGSIREAKFDVIENMYVYDDELDCYTYPYAPISQNLILKNFSSEAQILADYRSDTGRGITVVDGVEYYKGYPLDQVTVPEAQIRSGFESDMQARILSERAEFRAEYERVKSHLASLKNLKYYFVDKETGTVYKNIYDPTFEEATKTMNGFAAYIKDGDLRVSEEVVKMLQSENSSIPYDELFSYDYPEAMNDSSGYFTAVFTGAVKFDPNKYDVYIQVNTDKDSIIAKDEYYTLFNAYQKQSSEVSRDAAALGFCAVGFIFTMIALAFFAGNKDQDGNIILAPIDKVPNSIHLAVSGAIVVSIAIGSAMLYYDYAVQGFFDRYTKLSALVMVAAYLFFAEWYMSVARQAKCGKYFKNTIIARFIVPIIKKAVRWWKSDQNRIMSRSIKSGILLPPIVYAIVIPVLVGCAFFSENGLFFIPAAVVFVLFINYVSKLTVGLASIDSALTDAEHGNFDYNIFEDDLPRPIRPLGKRTNNLTKGMKAAIGDAVRNERMKTELITNVSHDLKTPLTSIITYTDLLKRSDIEDEKAIEYISILDEKAGRLKKLIEDLVEASKVSSGNVKLVLNDININEMVEQIYGEYEDDLSSAKLNLRCNLPDVPVIAVADGQKTYRIIENLFSNVKKYAMQDTRVYLDVLSDDAFAIIDMKNISKDEMHFDISNLAERFVRGDEARSTEGSGLGLSIAKSLTELQGGKFELSTDGDLFKVVIKLPLSK